VERRPNTWFLSGGYQGQNDAGPILKGMGTWRMAIYTRGFINFLGVLVYCIWTFRCLNSNLNYGYINTLQTFWGKPVGVSRCGTLETMHVTLVHRWPWHTQHPPPSWPRWGP
jgi:hypothetical protein